MYTVTYRETEQTALIDLNAIQALDTVDVELEDILDNCTTYHVDADLCDAAGFRKGWAHSDGTYRLL